MSEYLQPTPLSWIGEQLREKTKRGERYALEDAVQSYLLDQFRGIDRDISSYARMWGWGRATVYRHLDEIEKRAEEQRTFYRSKKAETPGETDVRHSRDTPRDKKEPSEDAEAQNRTPGETDVRQDRDSDDTPYISESLDNKSTELDDDDADSAGAREASGSEKSSEAEDDPLHFLGESDEIYRPAIKAAMDRHAPASLPNLIVGRWNGRRKGSLPSDSLNQIYSNLRARHGPDEAFARMVAGIIITGDAARSPNIKFLKTTIENFERHVSTSTAKGDSPSNRGNAGEGAPDESAGGAYSQYVGLIER